MEFLIRLWLPILASAVGVFLLSSVVHMLLKHHAADYAKIAGEEGLMAAMRQAGVLPGAYAMPYCASMKEMGSPEMVARQNAGPVAFLTVLPNGPMKLGPSLVKWFLYSIAVSIMCGYVAWHAVGGAGAPFAAAMRFSGSVAFATYGFSYVHGWIWSGVAWGTTMRYLLDGLVYAVATGAIFGSLWPGGI